MLFPLDFFLRCAGKTSSEMLGNAILCIAAFGTD